MIEVTIWVEHSRELHESQDLELHTSTYLGEDREAFLTYCAQVWEQWRGIRNPPVPVKED